VIFKIIFPEYLPPPIGGERTQKLNLHKKKGKIIMKNIEMIPSEKTFVEWATKEDLELTEQEAGMILGYVLGHGYGVCLDATDTIILVDTEEPENGIVAKGIDELIDRINTWNCEFLQDDEVTGEYREQFVKDSEMLDSIFDKMDTRNGYPIGVPTVKELIAILSKLPEDYRVYCCGGENYLYLWSNNKNITIDCERCL
jgi:hypothetical protein